MRPCFKPFERKTYGPGNVRLGSRHKREQAENFIVPLGRFMFSVQLHLDQPSDLLHLTFFEDSWIIIFWFVYPC